MLPECCVVIAPVKGRRLFLKLFKNDLHSIEGDDEPFVCHHLATCGLKLIFDT